ncbi:MAG: hypothetical protein MUF22_08870, partial [Chitinispirillaceae bacterium]|nr:hypothetical protein [Chitinispirillaceae bacterium]
ALVGNPEMLILDKPFSGVDDQAAAGIIAIIEERWKQTGMGIIMVTNALTLWPDYPVRRFVLDAGKLISYQSPDQARQAVTGKEPRKP